MAARPVGDPIFELIMRYSRRTKRVILGFLALGLIVSFIILGAIRFTAAQREQRRYEEERAALRPPEPNIALIENGNRPQVRRFAAQLMPWMEANVPAQVAGRASEIFVEAGTVVKKGEPLVRLDDTLARIAVDSAAARHVESQRLAEEAARLVRTQAISNTQYQATLAESEVTAAVLAEARENLARHTIPAPFDGIVNRRLIDVGDAINVNEPIAEVVDLSRLRVEFSVSENDLAAFPVGKSLQLSLPSRPGEIFESTVDFASRSADPVTRLYRVQAVLPNADSTLPGGLQGIVSTEVDRFAGLPFVPAMAVRFAGRQSLVWKLNPDGVAQQVEISVGPELDGVYPVFSGLKAGDQIIIR